MQGMIFQLQKEFSKAIGAFQKAISFWRSAGLTDEVSTGLNDLAIVEKEAGDFKGAQRDYQEALRIARRLKDTENIAMITVNLAGVFNALKKWAVAERRSKVGLELGKKLGLQELIAVAEQQLGEAMLAQRRANEALPHAQKAVTILTRLRSRNLSEAQTTLAACQAACLADNPASNAGGAKPAASQ